MKKITHFFQNPRSRLLDCVLSALINYWQIATWTKLLLENWAATEILSTICSNIISDVSEFKKTSVIQLTKAAVIQKHSPGIFHQGTLPFQEITRHRGSFRVILYKEKHWMIKKKKSLAHFGSHELLLTFFSVKEKKQHFFRYSAYGKFSKFLKFS